MLLFEELRRYYQGLERYHRYTKEDFANVKRNNAQSCLKGLLDIMTCFEKLLGLFHYECCFIKESKILEQLIEIRAEMAKYYYDVFECYEKIVLAYYTIVGFIVDEMAAENHEYMGEDYYSINDFIKFVIEEESDCMNIYQKELLKKIEEAAAIYTEGIIYPIDKCICECFLYAVDKVSMSDDVRGRIIQSLYFLRGIEYEFSLLRNYEERRILLNPEIEKACEGLKCPF